MKKFFIGIGILIGICLVIILLLPFLVDLDRFKETAISRAQEALGRDVDLDHIRLRVIPGLGAEITGIRIADNPSFSSEEFLSIEEFQVRLSLLSLLKREVTVTGVSLKKPVVRVTRNAKGEFSFSDLLEASSSPQEQKDTAQGGRGRTIPPAGLLASLFVQDLFITDGRVIYRDETGSPDVGPLVVERIDLKTRDVSLQTPIRVDLSASYLHPSGQNVHLSGTLGPVGSEFKPEEIPIDIHLKIDETELKEIPVSLPVRILRGAARADMTAQGSLKETIETEGEIVATDLVCAVTGEGNREHESGTLSLRLAGRMSLEYPSQTILLDSVNMTLNENVVTATGKLITPVTSPAWDISVNGDSLDISNLLSLLPEGMAALPPDLTLPGKAGIAATLKGTASRTVIDAELDMRELDLSYGNVFKKPRGTTFTARGKAELRDRIIDITSSDLVLDQIRMNAQGSITLTDTSPVFDLGVKSRSLPLKNLSRYLLLIESSDPDGAADLDVTITGTPDTLDIGYTGRSERLHVTVRQDETPKQGPDPQRITVSGLSIDGTARSGNSFTAKGTVKISRIQAFSHDVRDMVAHYTYTPDRLVVDPVSMNMFGGSTSGTASYVFSSGTWNISPVFKNMSVRELFGALTQYGESFTGVLSGTLDIQGSASKPGLSGLKALGAIRLDRGQWQNFDLAGGTMESLLAVEGIRDVIGISEDEIEHYRETRFDSLTMNLDLNNTVLKIPNIVMKNLHIGKDTGSLAVLAGTADLVSGVLDLSGRVVLSKTQSGNMIRRAEFLQSLLDDEQRLVFPLKVQGTIQKPIPVLDADYIRDAATNYYARKGIETGVKQLKERLGVPEGDTATDEAIRKLLDGILGQ
ncbi:MAG: AsmA family protein [Desulfomonilia bacterium]